MAIDVNKLITDAKTRQDAATQQAQEERAAAEREKANKKVLADSKSKLDYANTLKPRLKNLEDRLKFFANRIARGDKLDSLEQGEFDRLVKDYNSLNKTIDKAIKDAYDIVAESRGGKKRKDQQGEEKNLPQSYGLYGAVDEKGNKVRAIQTSDGSVWVNQNPYTGTLKFQESTITYKNGKEVKRTSNVEKIEKPEVAPPEKTPSGKIPPKAPKPKPIVPSGEAVPEGFDVAAVRAGEEASMGATPAVPSLAQRSFTDILKDTEFWYDLPDYIFKLDVDPTTGEPGELGKILVQAVNEGWDDDKFLSKVRLTKWWQSNSKPIRERIISRAKFNELQASGQDTSKTEFALDSAAIKRNVQSRARAMGANLDENAINQVVSRIYDGFLENDTVAIDSFIAPYIGRTSSILGTMGLGVQPKGYTGQALQNYQALQAVAKANGLSINDILPRLSVMPGQSLDDVVLQKLATGELDINRLAQDARILAAQGQPDYVKGLLQQGYDLEQIYAPYKNVMANILEVNADEIDLNDATLRSAIGQDREMNLFDFKKALRKDNRWQYTESAREEVANSVLGVLRDFGFQG